VSFILDADIRSFFDEIDQKWLIQFLAELSREGPTETNDSSGLCCNSATAKDFPSSGAIMG